MFLCQRVKLSDVFSFFFFLLCCFVAVRHLSWESVFIARLCFQFQPRSGILRRASAGRTSSTTTTSRSRCRWSTRSWSFTPSTCESLWSFHPLQVFTLRYKIHRQHLLLSWQILCPGMWVVQSLLLLHSLIFKPSSISFVNPPCVMSQRVNGAVRKCLLKRIAIPLPGRPHL